MDGRLLFRGRSHGHPGPAFVTFNAMGLEQLRRATEAGDAPSDDVRRAENGISRQPQLQRFPL
jgi:hypothetical protein